MLQVKVNLKSSEFVLVQSKAMETTIPISEVARRSGVASSALRFYEERGLIQSERAGSGHRRYPRSTLRRIAFIVFAQRIGLSLEEIGAELAKLPPDRMPTRGDWAKFSGGWKARVDASDCRASAAQEDAHRMYWVRVFVDRSMQARQPGGSGGEYGTGAEILDGVRQRARSFSHREKVAAKQPNEGMKHQRITADVAAPHPSPSATPSPYGRGEYLTLRPSVLRRRGRGDRGVRSVRRRRERRRGCRAGV